MIPCLNHIKDAHFKDFKTFAKENILIGDAKRSFDDLFAAAKRTEESNEISKSFNSIGYLSFSMNFGFFSKM